MNGRSFSFIVLCMLIAGAALAGDGMNKHDYPAGADVPGLDGAVILRHAPHARMIEGTNICEIVAGIHGKEGGLVHGGVLFYRVGESKPFMQALTREDGLVVVHFPAEPGEVILGRPWQQNSHGNRRFFGLRTKSRCNSGTVVVGDSSELESNTRKP